MACIAKSLISLNSCAFPSNKTPRWPQRMRGHNNLFVACASSTAEDDCNDEECAPDKEVGNLSMKWLAGENTKVVGTFPPKAKKVWSGYVEKDTAGQTNIYSVEPTIYVAESAISSGSAGTSSEGSENTAGVAAGFAIISIAAASSILLQVSKNTTKVEPVKYTGPPLSYYISKFKPAQFVETSIPAEVQTAPSLDDSVPQEDSSSTSNVEAAVTLDTTQVSEVQVE